METNINYRSNLRQVQSQLYLIARNNRSISLSLCFLSFQSLGQILIILFILISMLYLYNILCYKLIKLVCVLIHDAIKEDVFKKGGTSMKQRV
ncbi:unnamed protein product [Paramecium sonneborni]|uniref:Transmembrane protein n=1 Tax=Paramecium sonneborni TaxID=65129 RepID=A0A8S1R1B3_9CILI|nr:unnamed protein product [Paramecium sonneborni]